MSVEGATMLVQARVADDLTPSSRGGRPLKKVVCEPTVYRYQSDEVSSWISEDERFGP